MMVKENMFRHSPKAYWRPPGSLKCLDVHSDHTKLLADGRPVVAFIHRLNVQRNANVREYYVFLLVPTFEVFLCAYHSLDIFLSL